jgi:hypothetical protein
LSTGFSGFPGFDFEIHALTDKRRYSSYLRETTLCTKSVQPTRKIAYNLLKQKVWLPGMGSNHELDKFLKSRKLLILQSR